MMEILRMVFDGLSTGDLVAGFIVLGIVAVVLFCAARALFVSWLFPADDVDQYYVDVRSCGPWDEILAIDPDAALMPVRQIHDEFSRSQNPRARELAAWLFNTFPHDCGDPLCVGFPPDWDDDMVRKYIEGRRK